MGLEIYMPKSKNNNSSQIYFDNRIKVFLHVTLISLVVCGIVIGAGYMLDVYFNTKPTFLIVGLVLAFPLTQFLVYKHVKKITNHLSDN